MQRAQTINVEDLVKRAEGAAAEHRARLPGTPHVGCDPDGCTLGIIIPDWQMADVDFRSLYETSVSLAKAIGGPDVTPSLMVRPGRITMGYFARDALLLKALM